ncbi:MAG: N-acetylmuramoyl-L-alanine amidase, partial [Salinibacter sp.]
MDWSRATAVRRGKGRTATVRGGLLWGMVGLLLLAVGPAQAGIQVTDVAFAVRSDGEGYVMRLQTTNRPEAYMLKSVGEHELKWVVYNATLHDDYEHQAPSGPVTRYTMTEQNGHLVVRVILDDQFSVSATAYRDGVSSDLLLNLAYDRAMPVADGASAEPNPSKASPNPNPGT